MDSLDVNDVITGTSTLAAKLQRVVAGMTVTVDSSAARGGYAKLALPTPGLRVFDRCGWQVIREAERDSQGG